MVKNLLFRADDLGYSEAVNYGIAKTLEFGLVKSLGVMINMPATQHGMDLVKDFDIALGLHTNICAGRPLTDAALIPSLVDEHGYFKSSKLYRTSQEDFLNLDQEILTNSSLTFPRPLEVAVLTDPQTKVWLEERQIKLIDYREL
ncbi:ChbG/HpnK family deacetylase [Streptococcus parauberis]|uniref:ChbG/HpnK family deacetylase n=1 Tax=Streptococcus parauberis TaxID=1348 RepID=A0AAE4HYP6_9STRE|nr:ChbG/HpnK family deacetylase [Streptococcus parauberis]MDT2732729.1 ChbG/HpnK family deacetylase [Streptococcus parauberis]